MSKHWDFILTPIESILDEVPLALKNIDIGFDTLGLYEYIMQSVFLKMTGFQEQKMKCVCWELATDDYEYRYRRYKREPLRECSDLDEKNKVWKDLLDHVIALDPTIANLSEKDKQSVIDETIQAIGDFYSSCSMQGWAQKEYYEYENLVGNCSKDCVGYVTKNGVMNELFAHCENCGRKRLKEAEMAICKSGTLTEAYHILFMHRNRCAHNTSSYQHNLPSLQTMSDKKFVFENYFLHFALLIMIDKSMICLFKKYLELSNADFRL